MNFLADMVERRRARVAEEFGGVARADMERLASRARLPRDFHAALADRADVAVIAEVKKASPSEGAIASGCEAPAQTRRYQEGGAAAVSVLTEPESFGGSWVDLSDVARAVGLPVLCKDFVVDPVQLLAARGHGADAVLLMVSVLGGSVGEYAGIAESLGLTPLVEVVNAEELALAERAGARVVVVNARDLRTLEVDHARSLAVVREAAALGLAVVAASGVSSRDDVREAAEAGAGAVLVGTALMRARLPEEMLRGLTGVPCANRCQRKPSDRRAGEAGA